PLVDEFWITDENGDAYINTKGVPFTFAPGQNQASEFLPLLHGRQEPVIQDLRARELDQKPYLYVGVPGADKPRIVQVGAGEDLIGEIRNAFNLQRVLDQYLLQTDVDFIAVIAADGAIVAKASSGPDRHLTAAESNFVRGFNRQDREPFQLQEFPSEEGPENIGVVTRLVGGDPANPQSLFMVYRTLPMMNLLRRSAVYIIGVGLLLMLLALALSLFLSRRLSQPVGQLAAVVSRFGAGDFRVRAEVAGYREIQGLATDFNLMADNLERYTADLERETRRRERLESEMRIGAEVQQALLPDAPPVVPGLDLAGWSLPARQVGGDFFEYFSLPDGRVLVGIGDATDKGLPAALLVSQCYSILHALVHNGQFTPAGLLARVNRTLTEQVGESARFVTLFLAEIDAERRSLRYACAGHPPAILRQADGTVCHLRCTVGMPLGLEFSETFADYEAAFAPGDWLLAYSDGITEAESTGGDRYGVERLEQVIASNLGVTASGMLQAIHAEVGDFMSGKEQHDDMTAIAVHFTG
ncbi:MAG: SpoIIE family protein phosphatase, partial [Candidatus Hydrogenedentes bacterium]|nr:SpoIIE family protein phosphatase [Candidatus Hydrogenedentota bacterium]